jgi:hypothetical protein
MSTAITKIVSQRSWNRRFFESVGDSRILGSSVIPPKETKTVLNGEIKSTLPAIVGPDGLIIHVYGPERTSYGVPLKSEFYVKPHSRLWLKGDADGKFILSILDGEKPQ